MGNHRCRLEEAHRRRGVAAQHAWVRANRCMASAWPAVARGGPATHGCRWRQTASDGGHGAVGYGSGQGATKVEANGSCKGAWQRRTSVAKELPRRPCLSSRCHPWWLAAAWFWLERAGEGGRSERERVERRVPVLYICTARWQAGGHASSEGATPPAAPEHRSAMLLL